MHSEDVKFAVDGGVAHITLARPQAINALTFDMIRAMREALTAWEIDDAVKAVVIRGEGERGFCAGADVRQLWEKGSAGEHAAVEAFFAEEYRLNRQIRLFPKPYISLLHGITMGGGVGLSWHGAFRVVTEDVRFGMPETGIGLFPDVGSAYWLARMRRGLGLYLGLTGRTIDAAGCVQAYVTTHHVPAERLNEVIDALPRALSRVSDPEDYVVAVCMALDAYHEPPEGEGLEPHLDQIAACFHNRPQRVEDCLAALEQDGSPWAEETRAILATRSPLSMKVTFRQFQAAPHLDFDRTLQVDYRLASRMSRHPEFLEGVRAAVVDKDRKPRWRHAGLEAVEQEEVDGMFKPLGEERELTFPPAPVLT